MLPTTATGVQIQYDKIMAGEDRKPQHIFLGITKLYEPLIQAIYHAETWMQNGVDAEMLQRQLSSVLALQVEGDVVELGCFKGLTSCLFRLVLDKSRTPHYRTELKTVHVYDTFEGMPKPSQADAHYFLDGEGVIIDIEGGMIGLIEESKENHRLHNLKEPVYHKGLFSDTLPDQLPDKICFALLDSDWYDSIMCSLEHVYPRMQPGAICAIDDYCVPLFPGAKAATDTFLADKPEVILGNPDACKHVFFIKGAM